MEKRHASSFYIYIYIITLLYMHLCVMCLISILVCFFLYSKLCVFCFLLNQ